MSEAGVCFKASKCRGYAGRLVAALAGPSFCRGDFLMVISE